MTFETDTEESRAIHVNVDPGLEERRQSRSARTAKVIVVVALGALFGAAMTSESARANSEAESLTFEVYAGQYEQYKADLLEGVMPPAVSTIAAIIIVGFLAFFYEGSVWVVAWLIRRVTGPREVSAGGLASG